MKNQVKITHPELVAYLSGTLDKATQQKISTLKKKDTVYKLLFELIEQIEKYAITNVRVDKNDYNVLQYSNLDDVLTHFFAGDVNLNDARQLIDGIVSSPVFYQRLLNRLAQANPEIEHEEFPEFSKIRIKTDDELLGEIKKQVEKRTLIYIIVKWLKSSFDRWGITLSSWFQSLITSRRLGYVAPAIAVIVLISLFVYKYFTYNDIHPNYVYDDEVPYMPDRIILRTSSEYLSDDPLLGVLTRQFDVGISYYMQRDYSNAITNFEKLSTSTLLAQIESPIDSALWGREVDFYLGISYFALSRSKKTNLDDSARYNYTEKAIRFLSKADSLAEAHRLKNNDRDIYFLGLIYGLTDHHKLAVNKLQQIEKASQFYEDSIQLIKQWSE